MTKTTNTFYFYDLETTGLNPSSQRIVQFAGQRTDLNGKLIGDSYSTYVQVEEGVVPDIMAVETTGVSPQTANREGITELELLQHLQAEVFTPGTIMVGYNNVRFDDEFIRNSLFRNLFDPYEWAWKDDRSRWDILPLVRMARALRPDGIAWPTKEDGSPDNRLEAIAAENGIVHTNAHDAMSDVEALIALTRLIQEKQPKLFTYLLNLRDKKQAADQLTIGNLFVHTSGNISNDFLASSVFTPIAKLQNKPGQVLLYDLRYDPDTLIDLSQDEIQENLFKKDAPTYIPVKGVAANKCPAIAPINVLTGDTEKAIGLTTAEAKINFGKLKKLPELRTKLISAYDQAYELQDTDVEQSLYSGGFTSTGDRQKLNGLRIAVEKDTTISIPVFEDTRFNELALRFIANNTSPQTHAQDVKEAAQTLIEKRLTGKLPGMSSLQDFVKELNKNKKEATISDFTFDELMLYSESLLEHFEQSSS